MAKQKSTSVNTGAGAGASSAHWTDEETTRLIQYLALHHAEGGDGINFKQATFAAAVAHLLEPLECIPKENHVAGNKRDWQSCKNKWIMAFRRMRNSAQTLAKLMLRGGLHLRMHVPIRSPFATKGWKHFDNMDDLFHAQIAHGTNAFHAGQATFKSQQTPDNISNEGLGVAVEHGPAVPAPVIGDSGVEEDEESGMVAGREWDKDEEDIIPWEATPPPPQSENPQLHL
ncbi:hypothetical protein DEU56DRAFT_918224 [Suillus clintonianus]|uniref:uncharacterized protein n=1 Tax=Suillus clintonianus TaxID=1904413 RepID=UPI001B878093|nr:uncharacterized protein DEU56DRAFT_918224 [Suillus clintonianus]KAG2121296.1 hypothetical protein DEU56DRAFT_918224 [Suillus clintonianus]